jgi:hypothetical protein
MIKKTDQIHLINYGLSGKPFNDFIVEKQENGYWDYQVLPITFKYNSHWDVDFKCKKCSADVHIIENSTASFSAFSRIFSEKFIYLLNSLFQKTKVYGTNKSPYKFLTLDTFNEVDIDIFFIPTLTFIHFSCQNCNDEYLCRFRRGYPCEPDKGCPEGIIGQVCIDEIIEIKIDGEKRFVDILEDNKIL